MQNPIRLRECHCAHVHAGLGLDYPHRRYEPFSHVGVQSGLFHSTCLPIGISVITCYYFDNFAVNYSTFSDYYEQIYQLMLGM